MFGFVLSRSGAADYGFIQGMLLLEQFQLFGVIGSAVVVTAPFPGMCPGPILVNIGEGKLYALAALAGALAGAGLFGSLYARLQPIFGLPPLAAARASR